MQVLKMAYQHPSLQAEDLDKIIAAHQCVSYSKGDFILKKGQISNRYYVIESGLVRTYLYDYNGNEITVGFFGNNEVAIEASSLFHRVPTQEYMQCVTDCTFWQIDFSVFQDLFLQIPGLAEWGRSWMSFELFQSKKRATEMITLPATQRYLQLMQERPQIIQQAALKHIASYLGITDTSLSRIRKEISHV